MKVVDFEEKSIAEREAEIIAAAEAEQQQEEQQQGQQEEQQQEEQSTVVTPEINDDIVLSHIKSKYNRDISTLDELFTEKEIQQIVLDTDVEAFQKYKKETGRGIEDFVKLQQDLDKLSPERLLQEYYREQGDDDDDISYRMKKFSYDEELDSDDEIAEKRLLQKQELKRAKKYFDEQKEKYKIPLESRGPSISTEDINDFEQYKQSKTQYAKEQEENAKKQQYFTEQTNKLFSDKFEGFEFNIDENNKVVYKPADVNALKDSSSLNNLLSSFIDDKGYIKDVEVFHRAITIANDPEKFAKFFYEKGKSDAVTNFEKDSKNIEMVRTPATPAPNSSGLQFKALESDFASKLTIKKR